MKKYFRFIAAAMAAMLVGGAFCGCGSKSETEEKSNPASNETSEKLQDVVKIEITIKNYGVIKAELDSKAAPITVKNFVKLINEKFYDGLTFHRIISGFMIQGGDPEGTGMGGSKDKIKGEFAENGVTNNIKHERGVLSMARSMANDSASSQFFIMHETNAGLDGKYAAFGHVTEGIEIVDKICEDTPVTDNNGTVQKQNQPIIETIRVIS